MNLDYFYSKYTIYNPALKNGRGQVFIKEIFSGIRSGSDDSV